MFSFLLIYLPGPKLDGFTLSIFHIPDAEAIILFSLFNSQNKKINDFVFFRILTLPKILLPILEDPINFISKEIVTHRLLLADRWAEVPAPASIKAQRYPPWVIPAAFKWFLLIIDLNSYLLFETFLKANLHYVS